MHSLDSVPSRTKHVSSSSSPSRRRHGMISPFLVVALWLLVAVDPTSGSRSLGDIAHKEHVLQSHMSTKTMYPVLFRGELEDERRREEEDAARHECRPVQLNYVVRHGTRFPTIKDIKRIEATHAKLRSTMGEKPTKDLEWVASWSNPYEYDRAGWLAEAGVAELVSMGQRLRERFGDAFHQHFEVSRFLFEHTYKPRTRHSAMAFAFGFFGGHQPVHLTSDPIGEDEELRFFDNCPAFERSIDSNKTATIEHTKYRQSPQMLENLNRFRSRVGTTNAASLTQKDLEAAYAGCAFDVAVRWRTNEWCSLFDEGMLHSMDYFHDLKHFYKKSHGHALAFEIAAPLLQDIYRTIHQRANGESTVEGHFRFAHAETILPFASLLNLTYFDRHLSDREGHFLADTPLDVAMRRPFRGSTLAPFSANIGFVLYKCSKPSETEGGEVTKAPEGTSYRVQTLFHERSVRFSECGGEILCPLDRFERMYWQWIHEYDFFSKCSAT
ncbi:hypothetical protein PINS_up002138 [Pythium insidiosum]|nr:hypothetical protein PINS_up002138 [Pythium insidiosum]